MRKVAKNAIHVDIANAKLNILVIGGGRMGEALIKGLTHSTKYEIYLGCGQGCTHIQTTTCTCTKYNYIILQVLLHSARNNRDLYLYM